MLFKGVMYRILRFTVGSKFSGASDGLQEFLFAVNGRGNACNSRFHGKNIYGHTAVVAPILRLLLTVEI